MISIATFGDELLCLPGTHTKDNDVLMWQVDASKLPQVGSKVMLRLWRRKKPPAKADDRQRGQSTDDRQKDQKCDAVRRVVAKLRRAKKTTGPIHGAQKATHRERL